MWGQSQRPGFRPDTDSHAQQLTPTGLTFLMEHGGPQLSGVSASFTLLPRLWEGRTMAFPYPDTAHSIGYTAAAVVAA